MSCGAVPHRIATGKRQEGFDKLLVLATIFGVSILSSQSIRGKV